MGLTIVKAIIEAHGGQVEVTSQRGLDLCFRSHYRADNGFFSVSA